MRRRRRLGSYLASLRTSAELDLETAAARAEITPARLAAIEEDRVDPWFMEVVRLATAYDCPLEQVANSWGVSRRRPPEPHDDAKDAPDETN